MPLKRRRVRVAGWFALFVLATAVLLAPVAAQRPEGFTASASSSGERSFVASGRAEGGLPLPPPQEEAPAKKPRVIALSVLLKRGKSCQAQQHALASTASGRTHPHERIVRIHAQAVAYLPDPAQHLYPGRAPPVA